MKFGLPSSASQVSSTVGEQQFHTDKPYTLQTPPFINLTLSLTHTHAHTHLGGQQAILMQPNPKHNTVHLDRTMCTMSATEVVRVHLSCLCGSSSVWNSYSLLSASNGPVGLCVWN